MVFLFPRVNKTQFMKFQEHKGTKYHCSSLILVRNTNVHAPRNLCPSKRPPIKFPLPSKRKATHSCVWVIMCKGAGRSCGSSIGYCHTLGQHEDRHTIHKAGVQLLGTNHIAPSKSLLKLHCSQSPFYKALPSKPCFRAP